MGLTRYFTPRNYLSPDKFTTRGASMNARLTENRNQIHALQSLLRRDRTDRDRPPFPSGGEQNRCLADVDVPR